MLMPEATLPVCRHRGARTGADVYSCHSPKLVGLKQVTPALCQTCYCRDHELVAGGTQAPEHLRACAYRGAPLGDSDDAFRCRHPRHETTTHAQCRTCADYLFPIMAPETPAVDLRRLLELPPRPQPHGWWHWPIVQEFHAEKADEFLARLEPYPSERYSGRGAVIVGGGKYFPSVYVTVRALRHVGWSLPIQVYYFGSDDEMPAAWQELLAPFDVQCIDLDDPATPFAFPDGFEPELSADRGWTAKVRALLACPFEEALFLDADSYPCRNPDLLFDVPSYRDTGAIFWHDHPDDPRLNWQAFRVTPAPGSSIEAGQLLVHKGKCWRALNLGWWYASQHAATFRWGYGDKHVCFQVPWAKLGQKYASFAETGPWSVHAFLHPGPDGAPLFVHRCRDKFRFPGAGPWMSPQNFESNLFHRPLPLEVETFAWMAGLARTLGIHARTLNLGCGNRPLLGAHNHDRRRHAPFVETAHDLNRIPWPWPDGNFEHIVADDVLEHLDDVVGFMDEAHRVLIPGGTLRVRVPHYESENAHIDPTHRRGFHPRTLDFFTNESYGQHSVYTERRWRITKQWQEDLSGGPNLLWEMATLPSSDNPA
jgi:hypothetical protein